jgi:hypothetical protein
MHKINANGKGHIQIGSKKMASWDEIHGWYETPDIPQSAAETKADELDIYSPEFQQSLTEALFDILSDIKFEPFTPDDESAQKLVQFIISNEAYDIKAVHGNKEEGFTATAELNLRLIQTATQAPLPRIVQVPVM